MGRATRKARKTRETKRAKGTTPRPHCKGAQGRATRKAGKTRETKKRAICLFVCQYAGKGIS